MEMENRLNSRFIVLILSLLLLPASFTSNANNYELPSMGDPSGSIISPEDEKKLGEGLMRWIRSKQLILDDPLVNDYIHSIGYKLVAASNTTQSFTFFTVNECYYNPSDSFLNYMPGNIHQGHDQRHFH